MSDFERRSKLYEFISQYTKDPVICCRKTRVAGGGCPLGLICPYADKETDTVEKGRGV